jgi:hypothetical protein
VEIWKKIVRRLGRRREQPPEVEAVPFPIVHDETGSYILSSGKKIPIEQAVIYYPVERSPEETRRAYSSAESGADGSGLNSRETPSSSPVGKESPEEGDKPIR